MSDGKLSSFGSDSCVSRRSLKWQCLQDEERLCWLEWMPSVAWSQGMHMHVLLWVTYYTCFLCCILHLYLSVSRQSLRLKYISSPVGLSLHSLNNSWSHFAI